MVLGAAQGCCSSLAHITLSGCASLSQKRWDPNVGKQSPPVVLLALAKHRCAVKTMGPWHGSASTAQPTSNGAPGVAPETTGGRNAQPKSPTKKPAVLGRSTRGSVQHGFGCQCKPLWWPGTLMSPARFPERSLDGCHWVGGPAAQHTPGHDGEPLHPLSQGTHRFWGL